MTWSGDARTPETTEAPTLDQVAPSQDEVESDDGSSEAQPPDPFGGSSGNGSQQFGPGQVPPAPAGGRSHAATGGSH
jgi:hypothetical protein